jgi:hypothetical protein
MRAFESCALQHYLWQSDSGSSVVKWSDRIKRDSFCMTVSVVFDRNQMELVLHPGE